jgi:hypothetical protein
MPTNPPTMSGCKDCGGTGKVWDHYPGESFQIDCPSCNALKGATAGAPDESFNAKWERTIRAMPRGDAPKGAIADAPDGRFRPTGNDLLLWADRYVGQLEINDWPNAAYIMGAMAARIRELEAAQKDHVHEFNFLWKWVERLEFDKTLSTKECVGVLLHYPGAPWNDGVIWDVTHKEYAAAFYKRFPQAAPKEWPNGQPRASR